MERLVCEARAKVNLTLDILGLRQDGYHDIASVMHTVGLADTVGVRIIGEPLVRLCCGGDFESPAGPANLAYRAAAAMMDLLDRSGRTGWGIEVELFKRIPPEAGLGGGSADAAAVMSLVNAALGRPLGEGELLKRAKGIGADVPFLISGGMALAEGIGEKLTPMGSLEGFTVALAKPEEGLSTAMMYGLWDKAHARGGPRGGDEGGSTSSFLKLLSTRGARSAMRAVHNDFAEIAEAMLPSIGKMRSAMGSCGALSASMSGTGTAVFGLFEDEASARGAVEEVKRKYLGAFTAVTRLC